MNINSCHKERDFRATIFEALFTVLCPTLIYLPYPAVEFKGILTIYGVPETAQLIILLDSIFCNIFPFFWDFSFVDVII